MPVRLVGRQVRVQLHASHLVVNDGREQVAWHERLMAKGGSRPGSGTWPGSGIRFPWPAPTARWSLRPPKRAGVVAPRRATRLR
ncbi:hypothetical protein [Actinoplanes solisilvae]|uniref:hypothetical protein n=1 Tax=Actinoplanes solisilvae TaxID=2486853 RepID=UPI003D7BBF6D